jgi:uncharacterized protein YbcI
MNIKDVETQLAKDFAQIRKQLIGKGPEDIQVFIHGDTILVKTKGLWTPTEIFLLSFIEEKNLLYELQTRSLDQVKPKIEELICSYTQAGVVHISVSSQPELNQSQTVISLDRNFEKEIKALDR